MRLRNTLRKQIDDLIHQLTNGKESFDFEVFFSEIFHEAGGFDVVIANPPYLFLSGKGSPVQRLVRDGKEKEALALKRLYDLYVSRFPNTSSGCRDFYKWFTELAFRIAKPAGVVSYITPNTYIVLKKYADVRQIILTDNSTSVIIDLGFGIFEVPIVPSAVFICSRIPKKDSSVSYSDLKEVDRSELRSSTISNLVAQNTLTVPVKGTELLLYKHPVAERLYLEFPTTLKKYSRISEGEHDMLVDPGHFRSKSDTGSVPAVLDAELERLSLVRTVYIPRGDCPSYDHALHSGERCFLRKTGDRIVAAPPSDFGLAVAHQNVYVVHPRTQDVNVFVLLGLLNSRLLSFLYQNGIYGQKGRTLAQFRIYALYLLPVPDIARKKAEEIAQCVREVLAKRRNPGADVTVLEAEIDRLVYALYGLTPAEIKLVEESAAR